MDSAKNGYAYLKSLEKKTGKSRSAFNDFENFLEKKARKTGTPLSGQFELTPLCNFDCKMCYVHLEKEQLKGRSLLTVEQWKQVMRQAVDAGMINATLTGGECLTYPGFEELYLYLQGLGARVLVMTNGFLLDETRIKFFQAHPPKEILVTLYGGSEEAYERVTGRRVFQTVSGNIQTAVEAGLPVCISLTPNRYLGEDLLDTVRTAYSITPNLRINTMLMPPREETGRAKQQDEADLALYVQANLLLWELRGIKPEEVPADQLPEPGGSCHTCDTCGVTCGGGRSSFMIDWQGKMSACNRLDLAESDPFQEGFAKAWGRINEQANRAPHVPECVGCPYEKVCMPCHGDLLRFAVRGKIPEPLCRRTVAFVQHGIWKIPDCK